MTELVFKIDTKHRKDWFTGISFSHPAKMSLPLQLWLIENYSRPGDIILDPMAGSGTILVACSMGRNVICVELESKFIEIIKGNWQRIQERGPQLGCSMGEAIILQGDSRNLNGLLADRIITSPPYAEAQSGGGIAVNGYQGNKHSPTDLIGNRSYMPDVHGEAVGQIGYGDISSVIFSPPYEATFNESQHSLSGISKRDSALARSGGYGGYSGKKVDSIITSPPYEGINTTGTADTYEGSHSPNSQVQLKDYRESQENIGNLKNDSYLSAMLQVYKQCLSVLKPGGIMALVTKNFIRNKQEVRLDEDTIKLCQQAGFTFKERHYRKLTNQSFWRVIYQQKYPEAPVLDKEDILVFVKERIKCRLKV